MVPMSMHARMVERPKGGNEIPVPKVTRVPSYNTDYLPTFREPNTYIRGRGAPEWARLSPSASPLPIHAHTDAVVCYGNRAVFWTYAYCLKS